MARRSPPSDLESLAAVVQRLGVLLAAGVAPASGWGYVAEAARGSAASGVREVAAAARDGGSIADAILEVAESRRTDSTAWRGLAAAWLVASDSGAPLAATLAELAASLRSLAQNRRDLATALAGPAAITLSICILGVVPYLHVRGLVATNAMRSA